MSERSQPSRTERESERLFSAMEGLGFFAGMCATAGILWSIPGPQGFIPATLLSAGLSLFGLLLGRAAS